MNRIHCKLCLRAKERKKEHKECVPFSVWVFPSFAVDFQSTVPTDRRIKFIGKRNETRFFSPNNGSKKRVSFFHWQIFYCPSAGCAATGGSALGVSGDGSEMGCRRGCGKRAGGGGGVVIVRPTTGVPCVSPQ